MKTLKTLKLALLLIFALSLSNCGDKAASQACQDELKATKAQLSGIEAALDAPIPDLVAIAIASNFDFCTSDKAISAGKYDTTIGTAHVLIPVPEKFSEVSKVQKGNTVTYTFKGDVYSGNTVNIKESISSLPRKRGSVLNVIVHFKFDKNECTHDKASLGDKTKKSEVQGAP